ncbi:GNAT family N-acetyltransferase [Halococcus hamelinensis]|uniref:GNAT family N-acetyltransferase n=1 Tax=Halococcus hamelinensis TaxID=332168 RepID=UPI00029AAFB5|nr:GNAT family N-acetyltransferase [Halococcus hamelinensis]
MEICELINESERRQAVPLIRQLFTNADPQEVLEWTGEDDYHLLGGFVENELVGVAGVLLRHVLHHARHAWLYDLVIDEPQRGRGYGTALTEHVKKWATEKGCEYVALASPATKEGVHEYYEGMGYEKWGYVIEKELE